MPALELRTNTQQSSELTEEWLRQRSSEWEPKRSVLKHSLNGSWLCWKNAFHGWDQDKMNRSAERTRSMNSPLYSSLIEQREKARRENGDPKVSCVDRLISVKVARVVIGALDPDHRGNGLRKLAHSPSIEVSLFLVHLRSDARLLIQDWKGYSEKQQKKLVTNPERDALRERILEQKGKEVIWLNKKSDTHGSGTIVDCDCEVAVLRCGTAGPFTYSLSELETSKQFMHGRIQFALVFKDR